MVDSTAGSSCGRPSLVREAAMAARGTSVGGPPSTAPTARSVDGCVPLYLFRNAMYWRKEGLDSVCARAYMKGTRWSGV